MPTKQKKKKPVPCLLNIDDRTLLVLIPAEWTRRDKDGGTIYSHRAMVYMDRVRVLAGEVPPEPTPAYVRTLREALGLTQAQLAKRLGVASMTVARWEWGHRKPGAVARKRLESLRLAAGRRGIEIKADSAA